MSGERSTHSSEPTASDLTEKEMTKKDDEKGSYVEVNT
jgi:hypothetical protein